MQQHGEPRSYADWRVMGIVNVTPDSFYDGGRLTSIAAAVDHALRLLDEGADIVDIGGESTRPPGRDYGAGSLVVSAEEELERVLPVVRELRRLRPAAAISIDTMKPTVAEAAVEAGATMINDVSGGTFDRRIWDIAARFDCDYVLMHGHDPSDRRPIDEHRYGDVVSEVERWLADRIGEAREAGVRRIVADVGIGFAKGGAENVALLRALPRFGSLGVPLLVGASRKSFIGRLLGDRPPEGRLVGSLAAHAAAILGGASLVRVHDVRETVDMLTILRALLPSSPATPGTTAPSS